MVAFEHVQKLILEGEYAVAERLLGEVPCCEDYPTQQLLLGYVLFHQDRYLESIQILDNIIPRLSGEQLIEAAYSLVLNYASLGEPRAVIFYGKTYFELLKRMAAEERSVEASMNGYIAIAYADIGDIDNAQLYLAKQKQLCETSGEWLLYYCDFAYIMTNSDVISSVKHCIDALRLSSADNIIEGTSIVIFRLIGCCVAIKDLRLARMLFKVLQDHYYQEYGDTIDKMKVKYIPRFSLKYLFRLGQKTAFEKEIVTELKRLKLLV